jgi:uncharacterized protein (TIRG00374 family)
MSRATLITLLLWSLALGLAAWTLRQLPLAAMGAAVAGLTLGQWLVWLLLNGVVMALSTGRWQLFARALGDRVALWPLLLIRMAGQTVSFLTPGPQFGGEPLQVYWLCRRHGIALHRAVLSLGLDRFFDLWVNVAVLLGGVGLLLVSALVPAQDWRGTLLVLSLAVLALPALGLLVLRQPAWLATRLGALVARWERHPRLQRSGAALSEHWQALQNALRQLLQTQRTPLCAGLLLSLLGWAAILGELRALLWFLNVAVETGDFVLLFVAIRLAMLLPLPGGIGTIEAAVLWCFATLNLGSAEALGLIALMRLRDATILAFGLTSLAAMGRWTGAGPREAATDRP